MRIITERVWIKTAEKLDDFSTEHVTEDGKRRVNGLRSLKAKRVI